MIFLQISLIFLVFRWTESEKVYDLTHGFIDITGLFEPNPHLQPSRGHSPRNGQVSSVVTDVINLNNIQESEIPKSSANISSEQPTNASTANSVESTEGKIDDKQSINTEKSEATRPENMETVELSRNSTAELTDDVSKLNSKSSGKGEKEQGGKIQKSGRKQKQGKQKRRQKQKNENENRPEKPGSKPTTTRTTQPTTIRPAPPAAPQRYPLANHNIPNSQSRSPIYPPQNPVPPRNTLVANPQPNPPYNQFIRGPVGQGARTIPSQIAPQPSPPNGALPYIPNVQRPVPQTKSEPSIRRRPVQTATTEVAKTVASTTTTTAPTTTRKACHACDCFEKYFDRDSELPLMPYAQAVYVSEEECLTLCFAEGESCKSVSYGIVSGRSGLACELYNESALPNRLYYRYAMNYYDKNMRQEACDPRKIVPIDVKRETPDESPYYRKRSGMEAVKTQLGTATKPE